MYFQSIVSLSPLWIENTFIENIPVRIARPLNDNNNLPVIIYFHGGAFYMGSVGKFDLHVSKFLLMKLVDTYNAFTSTIARSAKIVVISVELALFDSF
jgi:acetyl esterase/lipase